MRNGITINNKQYLYVSVEDAWNTCSGCCFKPEEKNATCKYAGFCVNFSRLIGIGIFKELKVEK